MAWAMVAWVGRRGAPPHPCAPAPPCPARTTALACCTATLRWRRHGTATLPTGQTLDRTPGRTPPLALGQRARHSTTAASSGEVRRCACPPVTASAVGWLAGCLRGNGSHAHAVCGVLHAGARAGAGRGAGGSGLGFGHAEEQQEDPADVFSHYRKMRSGSYYSMIMRDNARKFVR